MVHKKQVGIAAAAIGSLALASGALAGDTTIRVFNMRASNIEGFYTTLRSGFVANMTLVIDETGTAWDTFAMDLDPSGTTLHAIQFTNGGGFPVFEIDYTAGTRTATGVSVGFPDPAGNCSGLTIAPDGTTYASFISGGVASLYTVDLGTGTATLIGAIGGSGFMIDITVDSAGNMYGHDIGDDMWYSIDTSTGAGTAIAPTGLAANFAQGLDADWSDDHVLATIYTGGGTGKFVDFDPVGLTTTIVDNTDPLLMEMEMACVPPEAAGPICADTSVWSNNSSTSGTAADTCGSDDSYFSARRATFTPASTLLLTNTLTYDASGLGAGGGLSFSAEVSIDNAGVTNVRARLVLVNQVGGSNATILSAPLTTADTVVTLNVANGADFIDANGFVTAQIVYVQTSGGPNWNARIDDATLDSQ